MANGKSKGETIQMKTGLTWADFTQKYSYYGWLSDAESLDSGMSLTTTIDTTVTESEFKVRRRLAPFNYRTKLNVKAWGET